MTTDQDNALREATEHRLLRAARELLGDAAACGYYLEIERVSVPPLAMGNTVARTRLTPIYAPPGRKLNLS